MQGELRRFSKSDDPDSFIRSIQAKDRQDRDLPKTRGRLPRFLSKRARRQRRAQSKANLVAELEAETKPEVNENDDGDEIFDVIALCLPCEDAAYCDDLFPEICVGCKLSKTGAHSADDGARSAANPLRNIVAGVNSYGSSRPWRVLMRAAGLELSNLKIHQGTRQCRNPVS